MRSNLVILTEAVEPHTKPWLTERETRAALLTVVLAAVLVVGLLFFLTS